LPLLFILWANLHGSFLIGLIIMWSWFVYKLLERSLKKISILQKFELSLLNKRDLLFTFTVFFLSTFSTLINPYGINLYSFLSDYANSFYMITIAEWLPFYYLPILYNQLVFSAIFLAVLILSIYFFNKKTTLSTGVVRYIKKINLWSFSLAILFFILSLKSKRHFPLFFISSFALIIQFLYFEFSIDFKNTFSKQRKRLMRLFIIAILFVASLYFFANTQATNSPFESKNNLSQPYALVTFLKNNPNLTTKKIFNPYSWGGYFLWTMPNTKIFIDGRMPQLAYNDHSFLEEYKDFFKEEKLEQKLIDHKIELVIIQKKHPSNISNLEKKFLGLKEKDLNIQINYLQKFLQFSNNWNKIYEDSLGEIYLLK